MQYAGRPYQTLMTERILQCDVLLAAPPGLGKTAAILDALDQLFFDRFEASTAWIVAPKIVATDTWPNEIAKWSDFRRLSYHVWDARELGFYQREDNRLRVQDPAALRARVREVGAQINLVSKDNFHPLALALGEAGMPCDVLVLDESWAFSDLESKRFLVAQAIRAKLKARLVLANGTPLGNSAEKLWAQMLLVDGGEALGTDLGTFRLRYMEPDKVNRRQGKVYSYRLQPGALDIIIERCRGKLVTLRESDWLSLPPLVTREVGVEIPMEPYRRMERDLLLPLADNLDAVAVNAGVLYNKLAQIACGLVFDEEGGWHELHQAKLEALAEIREGHPGPLLIWTTYQPDVARVKRLFPKATVANKFRGNLEQAWNRGDISELIAHPDSLAAGVNLQEAPDSGMFWFGQSANALHWNQGIKRLHRSGRRDPVMNYVCVARGTVEETMLQVRGERLAEEAHLIDALSITLEDLVCSRTVAD